MTGVSRTTIMDWVKQVGKLLPDSYNPETIPEVGELDELETFVGQKKNKIWLWTAVDHFRDGILVWVIGGLARRVPSATQCRHISTFMASYLILAMLFLGK